MLRRFAIAVLATLACLGITRADQPGPEAGYVVVVSKATAADDAWGEVVEVLEEKHQATVIEYDASVEESLGPLVERFPRFACFVARPEEAGREFVGQVHRLTRKLDDDPYTDLFWGILTGYDAEAALRIARHAEPLIVRRTASGTDIELSMCEEGVWFCELTQGKMVRKLRGGKPETLEAPADTTESLVDALNTYKPQLFVTSGHATERDWQIGFRYRNGSFRCEDGRLFGRDTQGKRFDIDAPEPKVYMPIGNCLMGHVDSRDAMALAWMNSAGVMQMLGYTVPTWFGYGGWGCLDYFIEQPGRYSFNEAFFANHHALVHKLTTEEPESRGLLFDRDVVAFYGDPAWQARMAEGSLAWEQTLTREDGVFTFTVTPNRGEETFKPINTNGSRRGGRPLVAFLPCRVRDVEILEGESLKPVVTDNFLLLPNPDPCDPTVTYRVRFSAEEF